MEEEHEEAEAEEEEEEDALFVASCCRSGRQSMGTYQRRFVCSLAESKSD